MKKMNIVRVFMDAPGVCNEPDEPTEGIPIEEFAAKFLRPQLEDLLHKTATQVSEETGEPYELCREYARRALIGV